MRKSRCAEEQIIGFIKQARSRRADWMIRSALPLVSVGRAAEAVTDAQLLARLGEVVEAEGRAVIDNNRSILTLRPRGKTKRSPLECERSLPWGILARC